MLQDKEAVDQYGVVGHPVAHSRSPFIHGMFAKQTGQSLVYRLHDVAPENFYDWAKDFFAQGGNGLNITVPHKLAAAELADELTARAHRARACNTLIIQDDGRILGDNTDGVGLVRDLCENLQIEIAQKRILIVGAGGATRGILAPLLALTPDEIVIANRTPAKATALAEDFSDLGIISGSSIEELSGSFDLILNATSAGLAGELPPIPPSVITNGTTCYDLSYGKADTPFVTWALEHRCPRVLQGWGMLVEQAAESFCIWRGIRPETAPVLAALTGPVLNAS